MSKKRGRGGLTEWVIQLSIWLLTTMFVEHLVALPGSAKNA